MENQNNSKQLFSLFLFQQKQYQGGNQKEYNLIFVRKLVRNSDNQEKLMQQPRNGLVIAVIDFRTSFCIHRQSFTNNKQQSQAVRLYVCIVLSTLLFARNNRVLSTTHTYIFPRGFYDQIQSTKCEINRNYSRIITSQTRFYPKCLLKCISKVHIFTFTLKFNSSLQNIQECVSIVR